MAVYVDDAFIKYRNMLMCHMIADTKQELLEMADKINIARYWIQAEGTYKEHFDICKSKRTLAIQLGAIAVTASELGRMLIAKRKGSTTRKEEILPSVE